MTTFTDCGAADRVIRLPTAARRPVEQPALQDGKPVQVAGDRIVHLTARPHKQPDPPPASPETLGWDVEWVVSLALLATLKNEESFRAVFSGTHRALARLANSFPDDAVCKRALGLLDVIEDAG